MGLIVGAAITGLVVPFVRVETKTVAQTGGVGGAPSNDMSTTGPASGAPIAGGGTGGGAGGVAASPGGVGPSGGTAGVRAPTGGSGATQSVGRGVTSSAIKLGIGIQDIGAAQAFGYNVDIGNQQARYQALINAQNGAGGINGRKIVPDFRTINTVDPTASSQAACIGWTNDVGVFSVLTIQFPAQAAVCVTGQGQTPLITTQGLDQAYYGSGLYFSTQASDARTLADQAHYLAARGALNGKTIGVVSGDGSDQLAVGDTLLPTLQQLGYRVADVEVVPSAISGLQRLPIAISNLQAKGVNFVIIAANVILAGPFAQTADRAGFHPQYALSDFNFEINDQVASYYPASFEGTVGLSTHRFSQYRAGAPPPPADASCLRRVLAADPKVQPFTNAAFEVAMGECAIFDAWVAAAKRAGPGLNRSTFVAAMEASGTFGISGTQDGSFAQGKHDAVDFEREVAWHQSCTCWQLVGGLSAPLRKMA
jgi:hypothetical protein